MSLTTRLLLLALAALFPAMAIQAYNEYALRQARGAEVRELALQQAELAASELSRVMEGVRNFLTAVAQAPSIRGFQTELCVPYLAQLQVEVPYLTSIAALDLAGHVRCRHSMLSSPATFKDRSYFQDILGGAPFVIGEFLPASTTSEARLPAAVPLRDKDGQVFGVVVAALDLDWLTSRIRERGYPEGGSITIADRSGIIIAREPLPERFIGTSIPEAFRYLLHEPKPGVVDVVSQDGTRRFLGYIPLAQAPTRIYVSAGLSAEEAFAALDAGTLRGVAVILAALLAALALAAFAGLRFIKAPVDRMLVAADRWRAGDLSASTGLTARDGELGRLGEEFDRVVSEVRERGQAVRDSEERLRLAVETTGIGIWDVDVRTGSRRWSSEFKAILGLPPEAEADTRVFSEIIHPDDRGWVSEIYDRAYTSEGGGRYEAEFRIHRADTGEERWVLTTGRIALDASGKPLRGIGTLRDTTERRRSESALRESEAMLRALADNLPNGMVYQISARADGVRQFVYISEGVQRILGVSAEEAIRDAAILYEKIDPEDLSLLAAAETEALRSKGFFSMEVRMRRADGEMRWFHLSSAPRTLSDDSVVWDGVGIDITARKEIEADLLKLNDTLEQRVTERTAELATANAMLLTQIDEREKVEATLRQLQRLEAVGQLTSGVAHDFNNLLTVILGNISFVERSASNAADKRRLGMIRTAAERGAKLTDQLLSFSRRQRLEPRPLDLNETVAGMRDLLHSTIGGSMRLDIKLAPELWAALADPTQTELVILNLAINARDAMELGGRLEIATANITVAGEPTRPEHPSQGDYVAISVADTGTGMSEAVLTKVFEPFFTTKEVGKGSGLGLAQVYGFAKQTGGGIRIDTEVGKGTKVTVYLPRADEGLAPAEADVAPAERVGGAERVILLVDDDPAVREVTAALLQELGYTCVDVASGGAGMDILDRREHIDLLLVDFAMPGMNGGEFARRAREKRPGIPVLFITGFADFQAIRDIGPESVLQKPFGSDQLAAKIADALSRSRSANRLATRH